MTSFLYPTDPELLDEIVKSTEHAHRALGGNDGQMPIPPSRERLDELLKCSFAASLETEEGRTTVFTLSFFADPDYPFDYVLQEPPLLSPRVLTRLAVAFDPWRSRICVVPRDGALHIGGFVHLGEQFAYAMRQDRSEVSVRVLGPGSLTVKYGGQLLLSYCRGKRMKLASHVHDQTGWSRHEAMSALTFTQPSMLQDGVMDQLRYRDSVSRIARSMLSLRHGGTLLIVGNAERWQMHRSACQYLAGVPSTNVKQADAYTRQYLTRREEFMRSGDRQAVLAATEFVLSEELAFSAFPSGLEWLAHLTATDGMTVILPEFTLLGFGVFFNVQEQDGDRTSVIIRDPFEGGPDAGQETGLQTVGGARHQSAAVICRRLPDAVAVVASQDGRLSSMKWDGSRGAVVVNRHLESLLDI
jgi:hypothetical protein